MQCVPGTHRDVAARPRSRMYVSGHRLNDIYHVKKKRVTLELIFKMILHLAEECIRWICGTVLVAVEMRHLRLRALCYLSLQNVTKTKHMAPL